MTVKELLARLDSAELAEWMAYARLEPFGPLAEEQRSGIIVSTLANVHRPAKRTAYRPEDFFAALKAESRRRQGPLRDKVLAVFKQMGGTD